jgi:nitrogen-specific signal transduction histidine kinase
MVKDRTVTVCCKDGKSKTIHIRSVVMDDGKHLLTYQDMTDHHNLEVHLRQSHKMEAIGTLAGGIAHDFNNILAAIIGYAEMTLTKVVQGSMTERNLAQILKAAHRAKDLIKQILIFTHEGEKEHRPVRIAPVVKEALKLLRASIPKTIAIRQKIRLTSNGVVLADPTQIHQVLINLCTNAAYAMREKGGALEVSLTDGVPEIEALSMYDQLGDTHCLQLTVSDTGCGIQPAIIERIFDPFFTTKDQGQGTGMGLAVVHGIVKSHDGAITVNSRVGKGSTFTVYLPRHEDKVLAETEAPYPMPRGSGRILFVDDEETLADLGKQMLIDLGYEVVSMTNSREALAVFRAQPGWFDLVFTDYTMPEMTGADLARRIMSMRPDIPVVLCTGYSETINEEKAREIGIRAFVMKPFTHRDIAEVVSRAFGKK